ncbi:MAG: NUDIX domain-containing protein [Melioribacteraceae bacterium]|nr:NUDIX domain-containing protein [Melioribacteraceae bacterium]
MIKIKSDLIEAHIVRIIDGKIRFLILKRASTEKYPNIWQMVTGKIRENEKAYETAIREIKEETALTVSEIYIVPKVNLFYNSDDNSANMVPVFLAIVQNDNVILSSEHQEYKWAQKEEAQSLFAWPGQAESINIIADYLNKKQKNLNFIKIDF